MTGEKLEYDRQDHPHDADFNGVTSTLGSYPSNKNPGYNEYDETKQYGADHMPPMLAHSGRNHIITHNSIRYGKDDKQHPDEK
jgi:hypothetical protein